MIISGSNFRSLAERDEVSFYAQMSINNTSGNVEFGFSGDSEGVGFQFSGGRMIDPEGKYFNSYIKNKGFVLSGNLETEAYEYYIDGRLNSSVGIKNNFKINKFFVNTNDCEVNLTCGVLASPQNYFLQYSDKYEVGSSLLGSIQNNQKEDFVIFTGSVLNDAFDLDDDVPSGKHDGTYLQDYKYFSGSGDLDSCNGRYAVTPEYPSGIYHYHVTEGWPYVMSCFKGTPTHQENAILETTSGTSPSELSGIWLTEKFFDRQTVTPQSDNIRYYTSGVDIKYSDNFAYVKSKGVPNHFYGPFSGNPNIVSNQDHIFKIPLNPDPNPDINNPSKIPTIVHMGNVGVTINGVPIDLLTNEFYKNRNHWRVVAKPGEMGLDSHNAHVQPNGKYHYHANPSGIISDYNFTTPTIAVTGIPESYSVFSGVGFTKYASAFGVNVFATSGVSDSKVLHAANVIAEYLDNDLDGIPDNLNVANSLVASQASLVMTSGELKAQGMNFSNEGVSGIDLSLLTGYHALQELQGSNTNPTGVGEFDHSLKETLHLLTDHGWSEVYPSALGLLSGSTLTNHMDSGRGGHWEWCDIHKMSNGTSMPGKIHGAGQTCLRWGAVNNPLTFYNGEAFGAYPSGSWYHNTDMRCDYACQSSKYLYLGITSILGIQTGREAALADEWKYVTATGLESGDPNLYNLLTNSEYKLPTGYTPTGTYNPSATATTYADTGHSPLIGYAFDGYPIYGPKGYVNAEASGEVKVMESSYLPKNTERGPAYPKTIKQYNDLYLPYHVDLIGKAAISETSQVSVVLNTNFGDINKTINAGEGTETEIKLAGNKIGFNLLPETFPNPIEGNTQGSAGGGTLGGMNPQY